MNDEPEAPNDREVPFTGWLALIAALESCRGGMTA
jgi:hypothetical protein